MSSAINHMKRSRRSNARVTSALGNINQRSYMREMKKNTTADRQPGLVRSILAKFARRKQIKKGEKI